MLNIALIFKFIDSVADFDFSLVQLLTLTRFVVITFVNKWDPPKFKTKIIRLLDIKC